MSQIEQKAKAVFFAFLVLFSTLSISADMHYCGKTLVDFKLYEEAEGCGMAMAELMGVDAESISSLMPCCSDVEIHIQGQDDLQKSSLDIDFISTTSFLSPPFITFNRTQNVSGKEIRFEEYLPPPLLVDIQILDQTFLI
ncbi:HYC_CC_PP family protein [Muriicola soli]|uniref:Uncharacterized protein n=1 Tax=Muriicola soli TaxID=2507538 RepID=A0A411EAG7_9FLAO|nr:hypothetical protein [Muriicola soli]QBA64537.1 hypothetical protein EQY75_08365 [Muriicola soli]